MSLSRAWSFIKKNSFCSLALMFYEYASAQTIKQIEPYILKPGLTTISKSVFLDTDTISLLNCDNCYVQSFSLVMNGDESTFKYMDFTGNNFSYIIKGLVKRASSGNVIFDNIKVRQKANQLYCRLYISI